MRLWQKGFAWPDVTRTDHIKEDDMGNRQHMVELLAPAGCEEGFYGAIRGGADAVYLAGDRFGARAYAENFTREKLLECIKYGHLLGRKLYLTVNTLLKESEFSELYDYLYPFYEAGMDAVIVQDLGVFRFIRENFPGWKLHVSTQMTLCSGYGALLLKEMGACRVVPARELGLQELILMKKQADIELEAFIHGAMCYCYSGQCLFSSIVGGRSGNRGRCAQPCRLCYSVSVGNVRREACYPLSLKDMCTIRHIPQLIEAGIDSFKIEGRMKKPEYAAGVTSVYRRYIDRYYELREKKGPKEAAEAFEVEKDDEKFLNSLYIRTQVQDGYYFKRNGSEMVTMESPSYSGSEQALLQSIRESYIDKRLKLPVMVSALFQVGQQAEVILQWGDICVCVMGDLVEAACKQPISQENVTKQLGRLGESAFYVEKMTVTVGEHVFYPLKKINELRRAAVEKLEEQILAVGGYKNALDKNPGACGKLADVASHFLPSRPIWVLLVHTLSQLEGVVEWLTENPYRQPVRIYVEGDLAVQEWSRVSALCSKLPHTCTKYVALPYILRESDKGYLERLYEKTEAGGVFGGFLVRSMDGYGYVRSRGKLPCRADAGLYVWNRFAARELAAGMEGFCIPYELKASEQRSLLGNLPWEKIVYSRIPMMITANCLGRTLGQCKKGSVKIWGDSGDEKAGNGCLREREDRYQALLEDRYHKDFPVEINCLHCMNIIYNSVPFSLYREIPKWKEQVDLRMDFTLESAGEVRQLLDAFLGDKTLSSGEYTTGHEKRGVE